MQYQQVVDNAATIANKVSDTNSIINTEHAHTLTTQEASIDSAVPATHAVDASITDTAAIADTVQM